MNYTDIVGLALSYADRQDQEVIDKMDSFLRIVEARLNRVLHVRKMAVRAQLATSTDQEYYGLPSDFSGLRDIEIRNTDDSSGRTTLQYLSPEQLNQYSNIRGDNIYYTIVADQLQIMPPQSDKILEIIYYQKLLPLGTTNQTTWLSESNPDTYVFGLLVEINSFVKDPQGKELWDVRFKEETEALISEDEIDRWSGTALQVRIG